MNHQSVYEIFDGAEWHQYDFATELTPGQEPEPRKGYRILCQGLCPRRFRQPASTNHAWVGTGAYAFWKAD